jgi:DNA-binding NtrC family response regulator
MSDHPAAAFHCLLLEDDEAFAALAAPVIAAAGGVVHRCATVAAARAALAARGFDLALLDHRLPDGTGFDFHAELARRQPGCLAIMSTGAPDLANAVALTRNGLFEYLVKPLAAEALAACLDRARRRLALPAADDAGELLGDSPAMREVLHLLRQAARHAGAIVLLHGETGTGKDLAARTLHRLTFPPDGAAAPYVALNCSALPEAMFEAELFGTEKGSYTGADRRRPGLAEAAGRGTLFLDEVGEIPLAQQAKLLRFLESREYRPLGSPAPKTFAGRVVAATNRSLMDEVRAGRFRSDLLYRLDVLAVRLPPLRERPADLEAIAHGLVGQLAAKYGRPAPLLRPDDLAALGRHTFPGNVRELRNLLERSLLRTPEDARWLALDLAWLDAAGAPAVASSVGASAAAPPALPAGGGEMAPPSERRLSPLELQEYRLIAATLREEAGAIRRTAARLGLTHQALLRRLQKWPELRTAGAAA